MSHPAANLSCACPCATSKVVVPARPLARFVCHCMICQAVFKRPFADVTVHWAGKIALQDGHALHFKKYRLPPAVNRGFCTACDSPVVGLLRLAPFVQLAFVASVNYPDQSLLPPPNAHIFYHSRVADIDDGLPKHSGYWRSELAVAAMVVSATLDESADL